MLYGCIAVSYTHLDVYKRQANNRRCPVYKEQLDKLAKPAQAKPRQVVAQPVKTAKAAEPVVRKPAPRSAPVPKPQSAVSPSKAQQAKPKAAPPEPEREVPPYALVPLPDDKEEIDPPLPPPPKPRYPRSGKKGKPQAKNTGQPKLPATGPVSYTHLDVYKRQIYQTNCKNRSKLHKLKIIQKYMSLPVFYNINVYFRSSCNHCFLHYKICIIQNFEP